MVSVQAHLQGNGGGDEFHPVAERVGDEIELIKFEKTERRE